MSVSFLNTQGVNDAAHLCQDPETKDFDLQAGQSWIYPTNYSLRDYQFNIIQEALYKNTLVSLPTGLGKTFIAAVVMYNFYRWYPHGKIIFMAPTRPLVKQQMDACYNIMAIPQEVTAELTGSKVQQSRSEIWQNKRVFFITPQVLQNDLPIIIELAPKIKCVVFDEAHRAKGNHAYCEVIRKLVPRNKLFRVLALSATPGNSSKDVIDVMLNLLIAHVEFRSEESQDVKPYVFERALETVVVPLGEKLIQIKDQYLQILERYTRILIQYKVIYGNCANLTKGKIFMVMKEFQARNSGARTPNYSEIMKSLNICVTLYHAYETLIRCGLRAFFNFYKEHISNPLLSGNVDLRRILEDLGDYLGPPAEVQPLPDGTFTGFPTSTKFGHPKFYKLRDILVSHFKKSDSSTRVIVFFEYRESASEAHALLTESHPMIRSRVFVGQRSGVTQRDQINTVKAFREGTCNTLLSTCIGEEGLDVGEVDLIVCFDIANKSPIRMIQRMGRTGRKKEGRVVVLVTEGREQQTLKDCLIYKSNLGNFITNTDLLEEGKYRENPQMIPSYVKPKCQKMYITVKKPVVTTKNNNLKDMLRKMSSEGPKFNDDLEIVEITERIKSKGENLWDKEQPLRSDFEEPKLKFGRYLEKQRTFQANGFIKQSKQTEIFVSLLQFADSKRYNIPVTQRISKFADFNQNKCLKQGDIRNMFSKPMGNILSQEAITTQFSFDTEKDITQSFPPELYEEISAYLSISASSKNPCKICNNLFDCPKIDYPKPDPIDLTKWVQPDLSIVSTITAKDFKPFADCLSPESNKLGDLLDDGNEVFDRIDFEESQSQRSFEKILDSFRITEDKEETKIEKSFAYEMPKSFRKVLNLFGTSICEDNRKEILSFFKLSSPGDIFESEDLDRTVIYSPGSLEASPDLFPSSEKKGASEEADSPILCTYERVQQIKAKKKLFNEEIRRPNLANLTLKRKSFFGSSKKETRVEEPKKILEIGDICDFSGFGLTAEAAEKMINEENKRKEEITKPDDLDISDICDLSIFGLSGPAKSQHKTVVEGKKISQTSRDLSIDDLCDMSQFFGGAEKPIDPKSNRNIIDLTETPEKSKNQNQISVNHVSIDLTDSDFDEYSPVKTKATQMNKSSTQLSITQMLSLVAKSDSQKENTYWTQERKVSNNKKGILQLKQSGTPRNSRKKKFGNNDTPKTKRKLNIPLAGDSGDEFEDSFTKSPIFAKPKSLKKKSKTSCSKPAKKRKKLFCEFIEEEAALSDDETVKVSEDEAEASDDDCFEASFVTNETQLNTTNMHIKYLESVRSPLGRGKFKIPAKPKRNVSYIFSQEVNNEDNSYLNDSFVVNTEDVDEENHNHDLSELEILEMKLKEMKKNKKRKKSEDKAAGTKRKRIRVPDDDSD